MVNATPSGDTCKYLISIAHIYNFMMGTVFFPSFLSLKRVSGVAVERVLCVLKKNESMALNPHQANKATTFDAVVKPPDAVNRL